MSLLIPARRALIALSVALVTPAVASAKKPEAAPAPAAATADAAIDPAFEADIQRLLALSGAVMNGQQVVDQMMVSMRQLAPELPEAFWAEAKTELRAEEFVGLIVPIWAKYYTHDEVKALIAFYESPVGRKMVSVQPAVLTEAMEAGRRWGEAVGVRIMLKVQAQQGEGR